MYPCGGNLSGKEDSVGVKAERLRQASCPRMTRGRSWFIMYFHEKNQSYIKKRVGIPGVARVMGMQQQRTSIFMDPGKQARPKAFMLMEDTEASPHLHPHVLKLCHPLEVGCNPRWKSK